MGTYIQTIYNKLVRDSIPAIIVADSNSTCEIRQLSDNEYLPALNKKLQEEMIEYLESNDIEELADIEEVIRAILESKHSTYEDLEKIRIAKRNERGGFEKRIFLESVTEKK